MPGPVVVIGLDAADQDRIERLTACGDMPNLAALRARSARGRLTSSPSGLSAMIWPKWFEGGRAGSWYFPKMWNPDRMCLEWVTETSGDPEPFWLDLDRRGARVCIVDVPQAPVQELENGMLVQGWQVHDLFRRGSSPSTLWEELCASCGPPILEPERYGPQSPRSLLELRRQLLQSARQSGRLGRALMRHGPFDLFVMVMGVLHRGGHYLWDASQVDTRGCGDQDRRLLESGLDEIYRAVDVAIGEIVEAAPAGARILVMSLHGMGPNRGWAETLPSFSRLVEPGRSGSPVSTLLGRIKRVVGPSVARRATGLLPDTWSLRLQEFISSRLHDWQQTPWFVLPSDLHGFLRLNLIGREGQGIVPGGARQKELEEHLADLFLGLRDLDGRPIVARIERTSDHVPDEDRFRRYLPDLLLIWDSLSASETAGIRLGSREIARWPRGQRFDSGRSGNHFTEGWYAACGPGIEAGFDSTAHDIGDIVPSLYPWLGLDPPERLCGQPIPCILPAEPAPAQEPRRRPARA